MTHVESPALIARCTSGGTAVGFAGTATPVRMTVETLCSCGERHPAPPGPTSAGPFGSTGNLARTWADPATGTLGRGALSPIRLYYRVSGGPRTVRFSTDLADLAGASPQVWPAVVAAALAGRPLPMPLTPYEGVLQLACGTTLGTFGERERLVLHDLDPDEPADLARRLAGRPSDPSELVRRALEYAVADVLNTAGSDGLVGDGGGLGAAALASAGRTRLRRLHVHLDVPVLDRRRGRLAAPARVTTVDGTPQWGRTCDVLRFGFPGEGDPWPPSPDLLRQAGPEGLPLLSGAGLVRMFTAAPAERGRLRAGWLRLTTATPDPMLFGRSGWRAWRPPRPGAETGPEPPHEHEEHEESFAPGGWISPVVSSVGVAVTSGRTTSHLVPDDDPETTAPGTAAVRAVVDELERRPPPTPADPRLDPVPICAHPVVLGAAVLLARNGRLRPGRRNGYHRPAPPLRALAPDGWRPADVTPDERDALLSAAFVTDRLAAPEQRARLLAQAEGSPWIDADRLRHVLSGSGGVLADARALHRLCVTAVRHPDLLASGGLS